MKKVFIFALAAMTFVACNKETTPEPEKETSKELTPGAACFMNAAAFNGIFSEASNGMARVAAAGKQNLPAYFATEPAAAAFLAINGVVTSRSIVVVEAVSYVICAAEKILENDFLVSDSGI